MCICACNVCVCEWVCMYGHVWGVYMCVNMYICGMCGYMCTCVCGMCVCVEEAARTLEQRWKTAGLKMFELQVME